MIVLIVMVYALLIYLELVPLYKNKQWHEFWVTTFLVVLSFGMAAVLSFGIKVPSPSEPIAKVVTFIVGK